MKNKIFRRLACFFLILIFGLLAVACSTDEPGEQTDTTVGQPVSGFDINLSEYKIIFPLKTSSLEERAVELLSSKLEALAGVSVAVSDDYTKDESVKKADAKEILIGDTNREASTVAFSALDGGQSWSVERVGQRIVISTANDALLYYAVNALIDNCTSKSAGVISIPEDLLIKKTENKLLTIAQNGVGNYPIVYPDGVNSELKSAYEKLKTTIESVGAVERQGFRSDFLSKGASYDSSTTEILVGNTDYSESDVGLAVFSPFEYGLNVSGNKLVVAGKTPQSTLLAIEYLTDCIKACKVVDENGNISIVIPGEAVVFTNPNYRTDIPELSLTPSDTIDVGDGCVTNCYSNATLESYTAYCSSALDAGFVKVYENTISGNHYAAYEKDKTRLYVSHTADQMRVTTEPISNVLYLGEKIEGGNAPVFTQRVLSYTTDNTNGMGYVLQLADGSFVIWDGGFKADAAKLDSYLKSKAPSGQKPHIRLWILTHMHGDHIQCFNEFAAKYAANVDLDYVGTAMPDKFTDPVTDSQSWSNGTVPSNIKRFSGAKHALLHTGDVIDFGAVKIEVLSTYSTLLSRNYTTDQHNDVSVVTRVVSRKSSILLTADIQIAAGQVLVDEHGEGLASTYCQVAHHGSKKWPTITDVYKFADPEFAFFPGSSGRYNENKTSTENKYVIQLVGAANVIVADGNDHDITLE